MKKLILSIVMLIFVAASVKTSSDNIVNVKQPASQTQYQQVPEFYNPSFDYAYSPAYGEVRFCPRTPLRNIARGTWWFIRAPFYWTFRGRCIRCHGDIQNPDGPIITPPGPYRRGLPQPQTQPLPDSTPKLPEPQLPVPQQPAIYTLY